MRVFVCRFALRRARHDRRAQLFVIAPAVEKRSWVHALSYGALFGLVTYATYDLTNLATLRGWPVLVTVVDLVWGAVLAASVSTATYFIARRIGL